MANEDPPAGLQGPVAVSPALQQGDVPDLVNAPPHYKNHKSGIECIDVAEGLSFCVGNALKYLWREDHKGVGKQDAEKAAWYLRRELARVALALAKGKLVFIPRSRYRKLAAKALAHTPPSPLHALLLAVSDGSVYDVPMLESLLMLVEASIHARYGGGA